MKDTRHRITCLLMTTALIAAWGCGNGAPREDTSTEQATVSGTVTFKGKPLTKGEISFSAYNLSRQAPPSKAEIGKDGSYTVKTLVGENTIEVLSPIITKSGADMAPFTERIKSGENKLDIDLPK